MPSRPHINRHTEIQWLQALLDPNSRQRILLIEAESGFGKTILMERFQQEIDKQELELATIDLIVGGIGIVDWLSIPCHSWGWGRFPRFNFALENIAGQTTQVDVHGNLQFGRPQLQIVMSENIAQRQAQAHELTLAWFEDIRTWTSPDHPAVIVVDTYNLKNTPQRNATVNVELHTWVESIFFTQLQLTPGLRLVLTGQQTPEPNLSWERCCTRHTLQPIDSVDDWMEYVRLRGIAVSREIVSAFCHSHGGHPSMLAMRLDLLRNWKA